MARPGLTGHRKFRRLARTLGSAIVARGALELIWESCYESGEDYIGTTDDIENAVGWTGERGVLTDALVNAGVPEGAGFIELVTSADGTTPAAAEARYRVHDLWHHAPDYVIKRRQRELARQQKTAPVIPGRRTAPDGGQDLPSLDRPTGDGRPPSPSHSPAPSPSHLKNGSSEPDRSELSALLEFPIVGAEGKTWTLSKAHVAEWAEAFPALDILAEARVALAWLNANPGRRKTGRGMARFLHGWFERTVNRGQSPNIRKGSPVGAAAGDASRRKVDQLLAGPARAAK
jgi:hypothetical protein